MSVVRTKGTAVLKAAYDRQYTDLPSLNAFSSEATRGPRSMQKSSAAEPSNTRLSRPATLFHAAVKLISF
jgi:hypothetical protein